jgi:hypothetical protein
MSSEQNPPSAKLPRPLWPQFTLRTLLFGVALCGVLVAIMDELGPIGSLALAWFLFLGMVHTVANYWGHSLRHQHRRVNPDDGPPAYAVSREQSGKVASAPATHLQTNIRLGKRMVAASAAGAMLGGMAGTTAFWLLLRDTAGYTGVLLAAISTAVIGGFLGFLASSFLAVFFEAWNQAAGDA